MKSGYEVVTPQGYRLANTDHQGLSMWAGYTSEVIHGKSLGILQRFLPPEAVVLDIGAGEGAFSARLQEAGYKVAAIDKYAPFQAQQVPCYRLDLNEDWSAAIPEPFTDCDGGAAIEVIEHVENPYHFLRQCSAVIKPKGYLLLTTPNMESTLNRWKFLFYGRFDMLDHEDHRSPIMRQMIDKLCLQTGFKLVLHTYDVDLLDYSRAWHKKIAKKTIQWATQVLTRDRANLAGVSNLWLLQKLEAEDRQNLDYHRMIRNRPQDVSKMA